MMITRLFFSLLFAALFCSNATAGNKPLKLTYDAPSEQWTGALPLGNGRLGAMVYGGMNQETIALNEVTLWSGQPDPDANNLCGPEKLRENFDALVGAVVKAKPAAAKGQYIKSCVVASTMGPGIKINPSRIGG